MTTVAERVAAFTSGLSHEAVPGEVREKLAVTVLHNLAVGLAGAVGTEVPRQYATAVGPGSGAHLLGTGEEVAPDTAAFVNATLLHARAQDDVYFPGLTHVGATLIPAVLALGEELDSSGTELVTALASGYEAAGALSEGFATRTTPRGFRATGLYGVLGAAAGASRLLGLDAAATTSALAIATSMSSGTNQTWVTGSQEWMFQVGFCARNGLLAARLAAAGGDGAPDAFEGSQGFYRTYLGTDSAESFDDVGADLGSRWRVREVTYKPYPVCAILQSPVTEAVALRSNGTIRPEDIASAALILSPAEAGYPGTDSLGPFRGTGDALMSAQFCLAVAWETGGFAAVDLGRANDADLLALARRIEVRADPELDPRSFRIEIQRHDGSLVEQASAGAESFNWDREGVIEQLAAMATELPPPPAVDRLVAAVRGLESGSVRDLVAACVPAAV